MNIQIRGARQNNLKNIDVQFSSGLTVVTGVSGSGKTSLVFDTLFHEAHRRFLDVFLYGRNGQRLAPAEVEEITGLGPTIALGQNVLNRNPNSILATASGLHPFFRLLFTNFGERHCLNCGDVIGVLSEDEIIDRLTDLSHLETINVSVPLLQNVPGCHKTLLAALSAEIGEDRLIIDQDQWDLLPLTSDHNHTIEIFFGTLDRSKSVSEIRKIVQKAADFGISSIWARGNFTDVKLTTRPVCSKCGNGLGELRPTYFNQKCPYCTGKGCKRCDGTGIHPQAASVRWEGMRLPDLLTQSIEYTHDLFSKVDLPSTAKRLKSEILRRLSALTHVGLGYLGLNRPIPSLSRGETQRVRLAISLSSRLEDMLHVLDEPTIGQHPMDVARFMSVLKNIPGPVIYVEHDRMATAVADTVIDLGPGAGVNGGEIVFTGTPCELWESKTLTGRYFSLCNRVKNPEQHPPANSFITLRGAHAHNLKDIDVKIPIGRMTVVTGVSGSGKSSLVEHVLFPTLKSRKPVNCSRVDGLMIKPVMVDQAPIGRNPRSNPATFTRLSESVRDLFSRATGLSKSYFSFNRPEGACPDCGGIGAEEIKMRYLPSIWIPCSTCEGKRFNEEVLSATVDFNGIMLSIADLYATEIHQVWDLIKKSPWLSVHHRETALRILRALNDVGLGYLDLGQPSPTLSGGEAQRVKLAKFLGMESLSNQLLILDEPSTGLHPHDLNGLLVVLDRLVHFGATIVIVEHNTDLIRVADWVIDLGPGAGSNGGQLIFQGSLSGLLKQGDSQTANALNLEKNLNPSPSLQKKSKETSSVISIRNARANNLKGIDVDIPKQALTVVTGVSGSGKSSLVIDVLQTEARRRYLESLTMYERQGLKESVEAPVDSISGLGVTLVVAPHHAHLWSQIPQFTRRNTVGSITELSFHLASLLSSLGNRRCLQCGSRMHRGETWVCSECNSTAQIAQPRHFLSTHWASSCHRCNGLGSLHLPDPQRLIINPDKPLCAGAMYSPGYWPKTYLCKDQPVLVEIGNRYGFDPMKTAWMDMTEEAQNAFLYGDGEIYTWTYYSKGGKSKGQERTSTWTWKGFYGEESWIFDWDIHGTYTRQVICPDCKGAGLRPDFLAVTLCGKTVYELSEMPIVALEGELLKIKLPNSSSPHLKTSLKIALRRLLFLKQVGIGYLHLNRPTGTLSAGEAQRIQLASLIGSELTSLTILVDEPSRGLHPSELEALRDALFELRDGGNTVIVVEHDPVLIMAADHVIDLGPGAGEAGGKIVAQGTPQEIIKSNTITGRWLQRDQKYLLSPRPHRPFRDWMVVRGARANNLRGEDVSFPLENLIGICGVSGSGKSTLLIDTVGRALVRKMHSSSFAREPIEPGEHDSINNPPQRTFLVDQTRRGISSPAKYLGLEQLILKIFANSDDALALGLSEKDLCQSCSGCRGQGQIRIAMDFLPDEWVECEICKGTGYRQEAWEVFYKDISLPEVNRLTMNEIYHLFRDEKSLSSRIKVLRQVGLGYLVWNQSAYTLSGGEVQRLKIAKELMKKTKDRTLYILDEPTVGLHLKDVYQLIRVLQSLVEAGHTVIVAEHHPHLLSACDWIIEFGPIGGPGGGHIIAAGTPHDVMRMDTPTAPYLAYLLEERE